MSRRRAATFPIRESKSHGHGAPVAFIQENEPYSLIRQARPCNLNVNKHRCSVIICKHKLWRVLSFRIWYYRVSVSATWGAVKRYNRNLGKISILQDQKANHLYHAVDDHLPSYPAFRVGHRFLLFQSPFLILAMQNDKRSPSRLYQTQA